MSSVTPNFFMCSRMWVFALDNCFAPIDRDRLQVSGVGEIVDRWHNVNERHLRVVQLCQSFDCDNHIFSCFFEIHSAENPLRTLRLHTLVGANSQHWARRLANDLFGNATEQETLRPAATIASP